MLTVQSCARGVNCATHIASSRETPRKFSIYVYVASTVVRGRLTGNCADVVAILLSVRSKDPLCKYHNHDH
jgi:hypothetical protein